MFLINYLFTGKQCVFPTIMVSVQTRYKSVPSCKLLPYKDENIEYFIVIFICGVMYCITFSVDYANIMTVVPVKIGSEIYFKPTKLF